MNYYLDRARAAALAGTLGRMTEVEPVIAGLARTFTKIYRDKDLAIDVTAPSGVRFRGETAGLRGDGGQSRRQCRANGPRTGSQSTSGLSEWMAGLACVVAG